MTEDRLARIEELFERFAVEPPAEHQHLVEAACGEDRALAAEVLALLRADSDEPPAILRSGLRELADGLLGEEQPPAIPERFGSYKILRYLNHGGMGWVYLAERDGLDGVVAIKFLRDAESSPARRLRFAREQRLLSRLHHTNIARLYDAGVEGGTPWFAMEYIRGVDIRRHCRDRRLALRDRLALFRSACEAVSYAHRNLTVHLDLKPSNILVNEEGVVKLLDFGIARNLEIDGRAADKTHTGLRLFSLNYAAPEQIRGEVLDAQTDVHGLGVVLYELLAGRTPADLTQASVTELMRFTEEEVQRPSEAASQEQSSVAASKADWKELDAICLKAMHRDRSRRYRTVDDLLRDVDRFTRNEPLEAQPDSVLYRTGKFLKRHRVPVLAAAIMLAAILSQSVYFTVRLVQARDRALASEARTQRTYRLMLNLFEGDDSTAGPSEQLRVVRLLDRGVQEAENLRSEPQSQAELRYTLGTLFHKLGHPERAEPLLRSALQWQKTNLGLNQADTMRTQLALAVLQIDQSRYDDAERLTDEVLASAKRQYPGGSIELARAQAAQGKLLASRGDYARALPVLERTVKRLSKDEPSPELSEALGDLANTHYYMGSLRLAEEVNQRGLEVDRKLFGPNHPHVGIGLYNLGNISLDRGEYGEAERLFQRALAISASWYGDAHPKAASAMLMLGRSISYQGRFESAAPLYEQALVATRAAFGDKSVRFAVALDHMGNLARDRSRLQEAERCFSDAAQIFRNTVGEKHEFYAHELSNLASVHNAGGRYVKAEELLRHAVPVLQTAVGEHRYTGLAQVRFGEALAGQKRFVEAERIALTGHAILRKQTGAAAEELRSARRVLHKVYLATNQQQRAREFRDQ